MWIYVFSIFFSVVRMTYKESCIKCIKLFTLFDLETKCYQHKFKISIYNSKKKKKISKYYIKVVLYVYLKTDINNW